MSESVSGHKRKGEGKAEEEAKRVKGLDEEEEEEKAPQEEGGVLKSYPPEDLCNVTVETDKGWKIKCHQADLFRFPNSQVFRTMFDKETATISVPASYFLDANEFVEFFDNLLVDTEKNQHLRISKAWDWKERRLKQFNFFGLDKYIQEMLERILVTDVLTADQYFQLGRMYKNAEFLSTAARHFVETLPYDEEKALAASVHLGRQLLQLARQKQQSSLSRWELLQKIQNEVDVFTDSINPELSCDEEECPKNCNGDSYEHPKREHFDETDDGDYDNDAFTQLGKVYAILRKTH